MVGYVYNLSTWEVEAKDFQEVQVSLNYWDPISKKKKNHTNKSKKKKMKGEDSKQAVSIFPERGGPILLLHQSVLSFFIFKNIFNVTKWGYCWLPPLMSLLLKQIEWGAEEMAQVRISCYSYRSPEGSTHNHLQLQFCGIWCGLLSTSVGTHMCVHIYTQHNSLLN